MTERLLPVGEVDLCVETFGSPSDPTILLIHGACASMLWWPQAFCAAFAGPSPFFDAVATRVVSRLPTWPAPSASRRR